MVNTELRRVKSLRLRAPTDSLLRRGLILAEDALRTASVPGAMGGRVLVVRSLKLGPIRDRLSPASLALTIERVLPYWQSAILPVLAGGETVILSASFSSATRLLASPSEPHMITASTPDSI